MAKLRTLLVGFGRIAAGYDRNRRMRAALRYPTHASVLTTHPDFEVVGVVDPDPAALDDAAQLCPDCRVARVADLPAGLEADVAVITTPPAGRLAIVESLPALRAVLVEKPVSLDEQGGPQFLAACAARGLLVQVNFLRRGDAVLRDLAEGGLADTLGEVQAGFAVYGRGAFNIATHLVDMLRMLTGEIAWVQATGECRPAPDGVIAGDVALPFTVGLSAGATAAFAPLDFRHYREAALDLWGTSGRLQLVQEGLVALRCPRDDNRGLDDAMEIASDRPAASATGVGDALYGMYDNLAAALRGEADLWSEAASALRTEAVIHGAVASARDGGRRIPLDA